MLNLYEHCITLKLKIARKLCINVSDFKSFYVIRFESQDSIYIIESLSGNAGHHYIPMMGDFRRVAADSTTCNDPPFP